MAWRCPDEAKHKQDEYFVSTFRTVRSYVAFINAEDKVISLVDEYYGEVMDSPPLCNECLKEAEWVEETVAAPVTVKTSRT